MKLTTLCGRRGALAGIVILLLPALAPAQGSLRLPLPPRPVSPVVEITAVEPFGPAYRAGLEVGDRILEVDGVRARSLLELRRLPIEAGYAARLTVWQRRTGRDATVHLYPKEGRIGIDARMVEAYPYGRYPY
jgi:S1-C subfamily serine protease